MAESNQWRKSERMSEKKMKMKMKIMAAGVSGV